jgi:HD-GYP domain-containing protein (c-di-GMP phosphodiesterase class II)
MHDVGKLHVPLSILQKPAGLTPDENVLLMRHTTEGARILGDHPRLKMAASIALTHHERWDGSGYPNGLAGEDIPLEGRIVKVVDVYDALRSRRPYKPALDHAVAMDTMRKGDGRISPGHFDPSLMAAFERISHRFSEIHDRMSG